MATAKISHSEFPVADPSPLLRYFAGIQANAHFSEKIIGGLGLQYQGRGFKHDLESPLEDVEWKLNYLTFTPNIEYKPLPSLGIQAGASIGLKLNERLNDDDITSLFEYAKPIDIGGMLGLKYYFNENLYLNLSYFNSLVSISDIEVTDENGNTSEDNLRTLNQSLSLGVGYNFYLKK
ncbi:MAG: porin family protein [Saprospiraceae bacterium]|nr:porin family protein [Saprospiraceae bacterium]